MEDAPAAPDAGTARALAHFAERPDAELFYLAQHAARYPPAVGAAAVAELQRRALVPAPAAPAGAPAAPPAPAGWGPALRGLLPSRRFWATPLLLALNLLVWVAMTASGVSATDPTGHDLVRWGSNVSSLTPAQPWRLLTSVFVHGGATHLLLNALSLWLLGVLLEARVGAARLLAVYLASGVAGSLATLWYHSSGINSVGASGAIFGLYGLLLILLISKKIVLDKFDRRAMLGLVLYLVLSNLIAGLSGNVDNAAHLGGLLLGALVAGPLALVGLRPVAE
ncbi:rhomboid family intramembrane serine protease [Hymenobacter nivis]|uniref:Peptidase S54 rhomboid domain-containing protein n=1 Tax=Hymenobacter nivis TaxID=1850093 RepID=A0A2Z3GL28_9BACT|nr:rhomboid family intramembrane serine protease [Hymenobacter nivis]AWM33061.1 hypothetical protein DDQ68_09915 [Hymenobacter nivis]